MAEAVASAEAAINVGRSGALIRASLIMGTEREYNEAGSVQGKVYPCVWLALDSEFFGVSERINDAGKRLEEWGVTFAVFTTDELNMVGDKMGEKLDYCKRIADAIVTFFFDSESILEVLTVDKLPRLKVYDSNETGVLVRISFFAEIDIC